MDPLSALSVAASVMQFLDFGASLVSETHAVYKSATGQTRAVVELSALAADLSILSKNITDHLTHFGQDVPPDKSPKGLLLRICTESLDLCSEISTQVEKLKVTGSGAPGNSSRVGFEGASGAFKSFIVVLRERVGLERRKIEYWRDMLVRSLPGRMTTAMTAILW